VLSIQQLEYQREQKIKEDKAAAETSSGTEMKKTKLLIDSSLT
jgi:hypothetical protein